jgi:hypothetical protein
MASIRNELLKAAGIKPQKGEAANEFLKRLVIGLNGCSDEAWRGLSERAQAWTNACIAIHSENPDGEYPAIPEGEGTSREVADDAPIADSRPRPGPTEECRSDGRINRPRGQGR